MKTYKCLNCGKEHKWRGVNFANKYCDNQCQKDFEYKQYITEWKAGDQSGVNRYSTSKHLYRYILEKQSGKCAICNIDSWNGFSLILELDHKDGDHTNNKEKKSSLFMSKLS